ncbi:MAG TPA: hypothetical protein VFX16_35540 [Pseudonocardiaceae bacterium]|nr:hypothetical protein [Pseudonocardiaceae bacterium]
MSSSNPPGPHRVDSDTDGAVPDRNTDGTAATSAPGPSDVLDRQKERFGGIKWGAAFFGWLTATGAVLVLTAIAAAAGTVLDLSTGGTQLGQQANRAAGNPATAETVGIVGAIVVLVVVFLAYLCGGYVAGRMARFNGIRQGIAVWLWTIFIAIVVAVAGSKFDILGNLHGLPRIPVNEGTLTTAGIITALIALAAAVVGAVLGGLTGMRYHRRIDRAGFDE